MLGVERSAFSVLLLAEGVRFELTRPFGLPVFKTGAINRSATPPERTVIGDQWIVIGGQV